MTLNISGSNIFFPFLHFVTYEKIYLFLFCFVFSLILLAVAYNFKYDPLQLHSDECPIRGKTALFKRSFKSP